MEIEACVRCGGKLETNFVAKHGYSPHDPEVAAKHAAKFPPLTLVTIRDFGGWAAAQKKHFADGGIFDAVMAR